MKLHWFGHSCFSLTFANGTTVVTDPFDETVGYPLCRVRADAVLVSHDHFDHNHFQSLAGHPEVVRDGASREIRGVRVEGVDCFHDDERGAKRGRNIIFRIEGDGLRVAHLGDLGHMPSPELYAQLQNLDVMLLPIGGTFTITTPQAVELLRAARPRLAVAMHFKTALCGFPITDEQEFVRLTDAVYLPDEIEIFPETLDKPSAAAVMRCPQER